MNRRKESESIRHEAKSMANSAQRLRPGNPSLLLSTGKDWHALSAAKCPMSTKRGMSQLGMTLNIGQSGQGRISHNIWIQFHPVVQSYGLYSRYQNTPESPSQRGHQCYKIKLLSYPTPTQKPGYTCWLTVPGERKPNPQTAQRASSLGAFY